jgi:hypothetical protein
MRFAAGAAFALCLTACATSPAADGTPAPALIGNIFRLPSRQPAPAPVNPPRIGEDETALRAEYGEPDFVRNETESELWRYDGEACALFLFLYREQGALKMRHAETTPAGENGAMDIDCLRSVMNGVSPNS